MARLTSAQRNSLPAADFAGPNRSYPDNDPTHARLAKAMVSKYGSPAEQSAVDAKVASKYPGMGGKQKLARSLSAKSSR
jgi:hypothetical protein